MNGLGISYEHDAGLRNPRCHTSKLQYPGHDAQASTCGTIAAAGSPSAHSPTAASADSHQRGLLAALAQRCGLPSGIAAAVASGTLQLDDAQRDYMHALLGEAVPQQSSVAASSSDAAHVAGVDHEPAVVPHCDG